MSAKIRELQYRVDLLIAERSSLVRRRDALKADLDKVESRFRELDDRMHSHGLISKAKRELAQAELERDDELRTVVVFSTNKYARPGKVYVVDKVTPKRIHVRLKGRAGSCEQFNRDGTSVSRRGDRIDMKATFGDAHAV